MKTLLLPFFITLIVSSCFMTNLYIEESKDYVIYGDDLPIKSKVFINNKTINGEQTTELIIHFEELKNSKFLTIAVAQKLIGYPENRDKMIVSDSKLRLPKSSMLFTPINYGVDLLITDFSISDSLIMFNTFNDLERYGKRITIKKNTKG